MSLNLRQLETFLWVATLGSFRKTAEHLCTTQPAISARIAQLEQTLNTKLFERDTTSIRLTATGQDLLPYAEKILRMSDTMQERATGQSQLSGVLRLGVSETIVHTLLPLFLKKLHEDLPDVDVELMVDTTINMRNDLVARALDLAFLMGPISEYSIANLDIASFPLAWVAAPHLNTPKHRPLDVDELMAFPLLTYPRNTRPYAELSQHMREAGSTPARIFTSSSLSACLRMAMDGIGICTLPRAMITEAIETGALVEVACTWHPSDLHFTASHPAEPYNPVAERAATLMCDIAAKVTAEDPYTLRSR